MSTTLEQAARALKQATSIFNLPITLQQLGEALDDTVKRIERLEAHVKALDLAASAPVTAPTPTPATEAKHG